MDNGINAKVWWAEPFSLGDEKDYEGSVLDGRYAKPYRSRISCAMGAVILPCLSVLTPGTLSYYKVMIHMRFFFYSTNEEADTF